MSKIALAILLVLLVAVPLTAQNEAEEVAETVGDTVNIQKQTQEQQDEWAAERSELLARFRAARGEVDYLTNRLNIETEKSQALDDRIAEMQRRLAEAERLTDGVQDTMNVVLQLFEKKIARDLPFLPDERESRLAYVRETIMRPDIPSAEKLRRLLEALQVEAGYGLTVEVYQDEIEINGDLLFVDILRLGRLSLFWRTPDGERVGEFDRGVGIWTELPGKYNRNIQRAMEMASRMRPIELISLPLGRITP